MKERHSDNISASSYIRWFETLSKNDVSLVGGKNASLGEMYRELTSKGIIVPNGFAVTADAYWSFIRGAGLDKKIKEWLKDLDVHDVVALKKIGKKIRTSILATPLPKDIEKEIITAYRLLGKQCKQNNVSVAIRSSATAEDLPGASFAGQQETFLHVRTEKEVLIKVRACIASLFTDRAISYRQAKGFDDTSVALSVCVQQMVDASTGASGVLFTVDTESGFTGVTVVTASYGLGEYVVQGRVIPDQYTVWKEGIKKNKAAIIGRRLGSKEVKLVAAKKYGTQHQVVPKKDRNTFVLSDSEVMTLATWGSVIEDHYKTPQDIEWVKSGKTGELFIVQARPETVTSQHPHASIEHYRLQGESAKSILTGIAVGQKIGAGAVRIIEHPKHMKQFKKGDVLVTRITDPDWEPIMRQASAIVTEQGGRTSHAAIVSRELGVPCIVGANNARALLKKQKQVTVSCASGETGMIYKGILPFQVERTDVGDVPKTHTKMMMNMGDPDNAFGLSYIPNDGVGLARLEFIFSNFIRIHPLALVHYNRLKDTQAKKQINLLTTGYKKKTDYCVDKLAEGIARIAAASYKNDVIVRLSDFKTNEYATMIGGKEFEPKEENPMLGWRGASRYYSKEYKEAFRLECQAIKKVRDEWGLTNVIVMVPFCRTPEEGKKVLETMAEFGLKQGDNGLQVYVMCEIPSNVILAEEFAKIFDGFSIGSNDLTQLTLGLDRDTGNLMHIGDATNPAVKKLIQDVIRVAHAHKKKIGICGQAPSDSLEFAEFLVREGIDSISLNPDTIIETRTRIAAVEKTLGKKGKKTHAGYLSIVAAFGIFAAGLMGLGAGCGSLQPQEDVDSYIAPAVIREKIEEKKQAEEKDGVYTSTLTDTSFAAFTLKYPANWQVAHFEQGVSISTSMTDGGGTRYMSIYTEIQPVTLDTSTYETISVDGYAAQKIRSKDTITQQELLFIIIERTGDRLIIEGTADVVERMLPTFQFLDTTTDGLSPRVIQQWGKPETVMCAQVITYAKQSESATCEAFPTPCDVPSGWQQCDMSEPVLAL